MGLRCLHTSIFIETPSLGGLPTKTKEDPSPHEMRLSHAGHQPSISSILLSLLLLSLLLCINIIVILLSLLLLLLLLLSLLLLLLSFFIHYYVIFLNKDSF